MVHWTGTVDHSRRSSTDVLQCSADRPLCPVRDRILGMLSIAASNTKSKCYHKMRYWLLIIHTSLKKNLGTFF